jgi:hypothetical protein
MNSRCECLRDDAQMCLDNRARWGQAFNSDRNRSACSCGCHVDVVDPDELLNTIPLREYPESRQFDPSPET